MKARTLPLGIAVVAWLLSLGWGFTAERAPAPVSEAAPAKAEKKAVELKDLAGDARRDSEFLSRMVGAYESIAFAAQPLENSKSVYMQVLAGDRLGAMRKISKKIARVMDEKGWKIDSSLKKASDERLAQLVAEHNGTTNEMGLLDALKAFHSEVADQVVKEIGSTGDLDVAEMAKVILGDQITSILTAKKMPMLMQEERARFEGRLGLEYVHVPQPDYGVR